MKRLLLGAACSAVGLSVALRAAAEPASRSWLRASAATVQEATQPSSGVLRPLAVVVVLAVLVLSALWLKRRRRQGLPPPAVLRVDVVSSVRVGPRAHAVVTAVGGRLLLLGVTDHSVRKLAWLEAEALESGARLGNGNAAWQPGVTDPATPRALGVAHAEPPRRFRDILTAALGRGARQSGSDAVDQIVAGTPDVLMKLKRPERPVEEQAAGLAARMQGR